MTQGKYVELSVEQRADVWRRWKAGDSLHTIGVPWTGRIRPFTACWRVTVGLFRQSVGAHGAYSPPLSERTSHEGSLPVRRFVISPKVWSAPRRR